MNFERYEDTIRAVKAKTEEKFSTHCDLRLIHSSITPSVVFAVKIYKPAAPSYLVATTHGWHMSIDANVDYEKPQSPYLLVEVDMRGRAYSTGTPDCNGLELYDVYDAIRFALKEYKSYLINEDLIYFEGGSGGGGNALAIAGKFPDLFASVNAMCPISDYYEWYKTDDELGEFRDEMDVWICPNPEKNREAYNSRSGLALLPNLLTSLQICHGTTDIRVPFSLTQLYLDRAKELEKPVKVYSMEGVGTREHFGNITNEQLATMEQVCRDNIANNRAPIELPRKGSFVVGGYLVTKAFTVFLPTLDNVATIYYNIDKKEITCNKSLELQVIWHE